MSDIETDFTIYFLFEYIKDFLNMSILIFIFIIILSNYMIFKINFDEIVVSL
jgi:hypothetical protein